jgi:hypothetical protein
MTTTRRPAIKGGFKILVVPSGDVAQNGCTAPATYKQAVTVSAIRSVATVDGKDRLLSSWAFDNKSRASVCKSLRELADYIEEHKIED